MRIAAASVAFLGLLVAAPVAQALRGMKFLLQKGKYEDRIKQVLAIDGNESNAVTRGGVGSIRYRVSSTDSNVPMNMGIPAVTIGRGGPGDRSHSPDEWADLDPASNARNVQVALALLLAVAGAG